VKDDRTVDDDLAAPGPAGPEYRLLDSGRLLREITWKPVGAAQFYHVTYGEEMIDTRADNAAKPSRWQRLKWWAEYVAQEALDFLAEIVWRIRKAWSALRHG
jgi:hypothetical protein